MSCWCGGHGVGEGCHAGRDFLVGDGEHGVGEGCHVGEGGHDVG